MFATDINNDDMPRDSSLYNIIYIYNIYNIYINIYIIFIIRHIYTMYNILSSMNMHA